MKTAVIVWAGALAPAAGPALAAAGDTGYGGYGYHGMMGPGFGWFIGPLMMLIFIALLVGAVVLVVRLLGGEIGGGKNRGADRSLEILRERFARGEIDTEEFEARRKSLGG